VFTGGASVVVPPPAAETALIGDSLTDPGFGITSYYWLNGVVGGYLKLIANAGFSGDTVSAMLSRVDNAYTAGLPGLAGLGSLGWVIVRAGTNDARAGTAIAGALTTNYNSFMAKLAGYAEKVIVLSVPPLSDAGQNLLAQDYNTFLAANYNSGQFSFVDDCVNLRDGSNNQISGFFSDGIHFNESGTYKSGVDGGAAAALIITGYSSPLSTSAADIYPAQPQWFKNPTIVGTAGTKGSGITGTVATNIDVSPNGANVAATCSIVSADVGDANTTPWQRVAITQGANGSSLVISSVSAGRAITTIDPTVIDLIVQIRFNAFDTTNSTYVQVSMQGDSTGENLSFARLKTLGAGTITKTATLRHAIPRVSGANHTGAHAYIQIPFTASFGPAASIGTIDFRCFTLRG
jgi:lysophospholipase L1-like esterase